MENDTEKDKYFRAAAIEYQKGVVNFKSSSTNTSKAYIWTYRTTSCDVLSVITTTLPVKDGIMKEINIESKKIISYKRKSKYEVLKDSPFQHAGLHIDQEEEKRKLNRMLLNEKKQFMAKLNVSRYLRTKLENEAASKIQAIYRGHYTRSNMSNIVENMLISKQIRSNIKSYLANRFSLIVSLSDFKVDRMKIRNRSAAIIQAKFIAFLSRRALRRRQLDKILQQRQFAARMIQAIYRGVAARARVRILLERLKLLVTIKSSIRIQTCFRRMLAKRKVRRRRLKLRILACTMIQHWYRAKFTKKIATQFLASLQQRRKTRGAMALQGIVRKFLSRRRVNRIRFRSLHKLIFRSIVRIQCLVRKFVATAKVQRLLALTRPIDDENSVSSTLDSLGLDKDAQALLDSVNIFLQASLGNTSDVEDIFQGLSTTEVHTSSDTNGDGDTLLTIAVKNGNMDLVRKCIQWGFDVNHKNNSGCNALMLAVKHNHFQIMQYIMHPPLSGDELELMIRMRPISDADAGYLFVAAGAHAGSGTDLAILTKLITMGLNVNAVDESTGMTAVQAVCEVGSYDAFMLLVKNKAEVNVDDDLGQSLLHKASGSSLKITQALLGLDPKCPIYMTEDERVERLSKCDMDGKDCLLHAILGGQTETMDLIESIFASSSTKTSTGANRPDINWSATDIDKAIRLVETGNLVSVNKLLETGFDPTWQQQVDEGATAQDTPPLSMVTAACRAGDIDCLDILLSSGADFSLTDKLGRIAMHYAAMSEKNVISYLLRHSQASTCNIFEQSLSAQDSMGNNCFHLAAQAGIKLSIDDLSASIVESGINMYNSAKLTPLHLACKALNLSVVLHYINLGADPKVTDSAGIDCLWQLFKSRKDSKVFICDETHLVHGKEKDEELHTLHEEVTTVLTLLRKGCRLYSEENFSVRLDQMISSLGKAGKEVTSATRLEPEEPGDIIISGHGLTILREAMDIISQFDCSRLLLASVYYDADGHLKVFQGLLQYGAMQHLAEKVVKHSASLRRSSSAYFEKTGASRAAEISHTITHSEIVQLVDAHFLSVNIIGWIIKFKHSTGLQLFVEKGLDPAKLVDKKGGNNCLHYIAAHGTANMVGTVFKSGKCLLERENDAGETAAMIVASTGNVPVAKKLFALRASARRALDRGCRAWVLAVARKQESTEKVTQTGRTGADDEKYFNIAPDPYYTLWFAYPDAPVSTSTRKIEIRRVNKVVKEKVPPPASTSSVVEAVPEPEVKPLTLLEAFPAGSEVSFQVMSIKASKLRSVELLGKNDPYVILSVKNHSNWSGKTTVLDSGGSDVEWNHLDKDPGLQFHLSKGDLTSSVLDVQVKDSNSFRSDVLIGAAEVKLSEGTYEHIHHHTGLLYVIVSLKEKGGKYAGAVAVSFKVTKCEKDPIHTTMVTKEKEAVVQPAKSLKAPSLGEDEISFVSFSSDTKSRDANIVPEMVPRTAQDAFPAGSEVSFQVMSIKASKLRSVELLGKNDPYVTLSLKNPGSWSGKTTVLDSGGSDVEWNNLDKDSGLQFHLSKGDLTSSVLDVQVTDSNSFRSDVLIGAAEVKLSEGTYEHIQHHTGLLYVTASLKEKGGKYAGTAAVSFKLTKREKL